MNGITKQNKKRAFRTRVRGLLSQQTVRESSSAGRIESFKRRKTPLSDMTVSHKFPSFLSAGSICFFLLLLPCVYYFMCMYRKEGARQFNGIISISIRSSSAYKERSAALWFIMTISLADGGNCCPWVIVLPNPAKSSPETTYTQLEFLIAFCSHSLHDDDDLLLLLFVSPP